MKFVLKNAEELIAAGFLIVTTALVVLNIICRYFFNMGMVWSEEVATGCFVWSVFIGAIACFKRRGHVGVDIVVNMLPPALKRAIATLMDIILVVLNAYMFYLSVVFISKSYTKLTPVMGISSAYISAAVVISFFMMTIYSVIFVYEDFCGKKEGNAYWLIYPSLLFLSCILQASPLLLPSLVQLLPILPLLIPLLRHIYFSKALSEAANPSLCWPFPSLSWLVVL